VANLEAGHLPLRRERVALAPILTRLVSDVHEGEDRGITLRVDVCAEPVHVIGDPFRLAAALEALVTAALRERPDRTSMVAGCRVENRPGGRVIRIGICEADGIGPLLEHDDRAGVPFDEYRGGMGFRFVLASRIIAAHGGRVVTPVADRGHLAIVVSLPLAPEPEGSGPS
jgi:signal transduction histidine kinase